LKAIRNKIYYKEVYFSHFIYKHYTLLISISKNKRIIMLSYNFIIKQQKNDKR